MGVLAQIHDNPYQMQFTASSIDYPRLSYLAPRTEWQPLLRSVCHLMHESFADASARRFGLKASG